MTRRIVISPEEYQVRLGQLYISEIPRYEVRGITCVDVTVLGAEFDRSINNWKKKKSTIDLIAGLFIGSIVRTAVFMDDVGYGNRYYIDERLLPDFIIYADPFKASNYFSPPVADVPPGPVETGDVEFPVAPIGLPAITEQQCSSHILYKESNGAEWADARTRLRQSIPIFHGTVIDQTRETVTDCTQGAFMRILISCQTPFDDMELDQLIRTCSIVDAAVIHLSKYRFNTLVECRIAIEKVSEAAGPWAWDVATDQETAEVAEIAEATEVCTREIPVMPIQATAAPAYRLAILEGQLMSVLQQVPLIFAELLSIREEINAEDTQTNTRDDDARSSRPLSG